MASGQPQAGDQSRAARIALAAVLLCVAAAGARAVIPAASWTDGPWRRHGLAVGVVLEVVLLALLAAVEVRRRRHPDAGLPAARLRAVLRVLLVAGVIAIPVLILINAAGKLPPPRPNRHLLRLQQGRRQGVAHPHGGPSGGGGADWTLILYIVLLVALLAAVAGCVIWLRRRARRQPWEEIADLGEDDEPAGQLRRAVASGQAALGEIDDARLAIIACYAAMERSLARAGAERGAAETPDELLSRAAAAGLVQGGEAGRLTELFYEARFSSHPLPARRRDEARQALAVLAGHLDAAARRAAAAAAAAASAAGGTSTAPGGPGPAGGTGGQR
ncbi:MAG TPA: DUF4129 domain-containing protein [Streptosporangiaceae bacterium]|nr:DUF4129 domain-containing protein [Streptosporangiaceae bacterium]